MKTILCFLLLRIFVAAPLPTQNARSTAVSAHGGSGQYTAGPSAGQESAAISSWSLTHQDAAFRQDSGGSAPSYGGTEAALVTLKPSFAPSRANPSDHAAKLSSLGIHSSSVMGGAFPALDDNVAASPMGVLSPISVAADYAVFGSEGPADGRPMSDSPDPSGGLNSLPTADSVPLALQATSSGGQQSSADLQVGSVNRPSLQPSHPTAPGSSKHSGTNTHGTPAGGPPALPVAQQSKTAQQSAGVREALQGNPPPAPQAQGPAFSLQYNVQMDPNAPALNTPARAPLVPLAPPAVEQQLRQTNLFVMGLDKAEQQQQQHTPDSLAFASVNGAAGGPKGLSSIPGFAPHVQAAAHPANELRVPCNNLVDALFVLDDVSNVWLVRESLRHYATQLLASPRARFGAVLCGNTQTFYTNMQSHFSVLVASLEDLQHANASLDPSEQMPDTPGYRGDNNPYPPRVSEDFALSTAGCLETVFHLLSSSSQKGGPVPERLVSVMGTKERWSDPAVLEEARFLRSLNFSLLTLADGRLSARASDTLRNMASTPDKFRTVIDNVTMHALPAMIGNAVCRPHKADVTIVVQRTQTMKLQEPSVSGCRQVNATALQRTTDFGRFFGTHVDYVTCPLGVIPNLQKCLCA